MGRQGPHFHRRHGPARRLTPSRPPRPLRVGPGAPSLLVPRGRGLASCGASRTKAASGQGAEAVRGSGPSPGQRVPAPSPTPTRSLRARVRALARRPPRRPPARGSGPLPAEGTGRQLPVGRGGPWRPVSMSVGVSLTPHAATPAAAIFSPAHTHSHRPPRLRTGRAPRGAGRPDAPGPRCACAADRWACVAGAGLGWTLNPFHAG